MTAPEEPHADLIEEMLQHANAEEGRADGNALTADRYRRAAAALGDTVPREPLERYDEHGRAFVTSTRADWDTIERERDDARAERDALAHFRDQVRHIMASGYGDIRDAVADLQEAAAAAPAVSLALHDAEVKAQALDEAREAISTKPAMLALPERFLAARAAAIREDTIKEDK